MVSLSLAVLPEQGGHLILAMGGLDHKIHIYCGDKAGKVCNLMFLQHLFFLSIFPFLATLTTHFSVRSSLRPVSLKVILIGSEV
jgi:hypothetical protein